MKTSRQPVSFVATAQPDHALLFYRDTLGLTLMEQSPYALVFADGDIMLRVQIVTDLTPAPHTVHGWQVGDIANDIKNLSSLGVAFLKFSHLDQDASGAWTTPDGHRIAWFKDPDGNILSLTQYA